jgi:histidinol dehydrogenase
MGGAGAIGAFAYGVPGIGLDPVEIITGPGNVYVAAAKRLVRGRVGIDSEAGPTEILVIADASANAELVAADLVSQAEHDELAAAVLVTDSPELALSVAAAVERLARSTAHGDRVRVALAGEQSAIVLVSTLGAAAAFSNAYRPEHLEIHTETPGVVLDLIESAGAIFLGENSPVSLGYYLAGSNHVLPTGGQSRFSSAVPAGSRRSAVDPGRGSRRSAPWPGRGRPLDRARRGLGARNGRRPALDHHVRPSSRQSLHGPRRHHRSGRPAGRR